MDVRFYGGAGCVTGSCHILTIKNKTYLLDCGLFQGSDGNNGANETFPFNPKDINGVILSHAHIDHCGRIPMLYKKGFRGKVLCTYETKELCKIMLQDCAGIMEKLRKKEWILYSKEDASKCMELFEGINYNEEISLERGVKLQFKDAGHLLGSAITILDCDGERLVYSGDLGNINTPIIRDPSKVDYADIVLMESTYGNKEHEKGDYFKELLQIIKNTLDRDGNVIIPSFSVGRTQEILYILNSFVENGEIKGRVFVDSPLAVEATKIFRNNWQDFDEAAKKLIKNGDDPLNFKKLIFTEKKEESININNVKRGAVIISSSGMCDNGRIRHHLVNNIENSKNSIVFVGYQAMGTLGRKILDGEKKVKILGDFKEVKCEVHSIPALSGHADNLGLIKWVENFKMKPKLIILVHGEENSQKILRENLDKKGYNVVVGEKDKNMRDIYRIWLEK